jgi:hypothetical protein
MEKYWSIVMTGVRPLKKGFIKKKKKEKKAARIEKAKRDSNGTTPFKTDNRTARTPRRS